METLDQTINFIFGNKPGWYYISGFFFSFIAIYLSLWLHSKKRNVNSPNTPIKYSKKFLLWDNANRLFVGMLILFVFYRMFDIMNVWGMLGLGFFISFGLDKAIEWLMENTNIANILKRNRDKFMEKNNENE